MEMEEVGLTLEKRRRRNSVRERKERVEEGRNMGS